MNHQKIDYKVISTRNTSWLGVDVDLEQLEEKLNHLGMDGWDLINTFDINESHGRTKEVVMILKRHDR